MSKNIHASVIFYPDVFFLIFSDISFLSLPCTRYHITSLSLARVNFATITLQTCSCALPFSTVWIELTCIYYLSMCMQIVICVFQKEKLLRQLLYCCLPLLIFLLQIYTTPATKLIIFYLSRAHTLFYILHLTQLHSLKKFKIPFFCLAKCIDRILAVWCIHCHDSSLFRTSSTVKKRQPQKYSVHWANEVFVQ